MTPTLDIIIVSFNTRDDVRACLQSLSTSSPRALGHIFVVDNASSDGTPDMVRREWPDVRLLPLDRNVGFGAANNVALRESQADLVLFLNSDTLVPAGAIDALVERLEVTGAAAAGPRLVDAAGRVEVSFGRMLTPWVEIRQAIRVRLSRRDHAWARRYVAQHAAHEREVDWVTGACLLARRRSVVDAGLFDERYFMYEEDVDLCAAIRARGGRVIFTPAAEVVHLRGRSGGASRTRAAYDASHLAFYRKHAPRWARLLQWWIGTDGSSS